MSWLERIIIFSVVIALVGFTVWMQSDLLEEPVNEEQIITESHDPDYYIENFTAIGMDTDGNRQYLLEAERMVHFPDDDTSLLDKPHVIQYGSGRTPTHIYSETGWVSANGDEVKLTGNVRVIRGRDGTGSGGVTTTDTLNIVLKEPIS
ncbi:MAG: LPS export ABC transporter periplasmic protein LptC [Gammaproteobacteria bacterium]|nr:LPS export ABC transporter periplasmic protein LptC [Gammaproteobacteria bacterium]